MKPDVGENLNRIFIEQRGLIDEALKEGGREAIRRHKQAGLPLVIYRDGKTVWVQPEELPTEGL